MREKENTTKKQTTLLDQYIQRTITDKMQELEEKALAEAIRSMLLKDGQDTPSFH